MKVQLFIQFCIFSSKKEGYHFEIGSNLAISSSEKVRIYHQRFPPKKIYRHFGELSCKKKSLHCNTTHIYVGLALEVALCQKNHILVRLKKEEEYLLANMYIGQVKIGPKLFWMER
jgi:hypothetical protein